MKFNNYLLIGVLILFSCEKEEIPLLPPVSGDLTTVQIAMDYPYANQVYFELATAKVQKTNDKNEWDIAFSSNGEEVILNTGNSVLVANMGAINFHSEQTTDDVLWLRDSIHTRPLHTAFGIIDTAFTYLLYTDDTWKIKFLRNTLDTMLFVRTVLGKNTIDTITIVKDKLANYTTYSFSLGQNNMEPDREQWDLLFTPYQKYFWTPNAMWVTVTGCLINKENGVEVAECNASNFNDVVLSDTSLFSFNNAEDVIGHEWKERVAADNSFNILADKYYIIKSVQGIYFKLHFIDFYNDQGLKGYPKFEMRRL